jgi:hypothetical protein
MKLYHSPNDSYAGTYTHIYIHFYIDRFTSKLACARVFFFLLFLQNLDYVVSNDRVTDAVERIWKEAVMV